ncbi:LysR family transcriptional regulator [Adlercreutzia caecimuris]|uniref:LysR family transcriptional regulator n=1 Tax=Adlercreutzia caecimuris TaxID=671266 RepID=UPI002493DA50|nr:LysR family transcriptional regulator [Adlercreutzia caecimuris]
MLDKRVTTFIQVVESGSIAKAARLLYLSKVSVKAQMDSLEAEVGVRLLERTTRGVKVTAAGKLFFEGARKLAYLSDRTLAKVRAADAGERRVVRVGTSVLRPCRPLLELWESLGPGKPDIALEIVPFDDDTASLNEVADELGRRIDCFVAPAIPTAGEPRPTSCCWTSCPTALPCPGPIRWPSAISSTGTIWTARPS